MTENAIAVINDQNISQFFAAGGLDPIIKKIRDEVLSFAPDISTEKGRKEIASMARKVASSKVALDDMGKNLNATLKAQTSAVDAERKRMRETLDELKDEVRKPLTEYEDKEAARTQAHQDILSAIETLGAAENQTAADIETRIKALEQYEGREWEEFVHIAQEKYKAVHAILTQRLAAAKKAEAEREELDRLRASEAKRAQEDKEREQRERDEKLQRDAAEKAKRDAEESARASIAAAEAQARKAEEDRIKAEQKAEKDKEAAVAAEKARADKAKKDEEAATAARAANTQHKAKVNNEALDGLRIAIAIACPELAAGKIDAIGKGIIECIAKRQILHLQINY